MHSLASPCLLGSGKYWPAPRACVQQRAPLAGLLHFRTKDQAGTEASSNAELEEEQFCNTPLQLHHQYIQHQQQNQQPPCMHTSSVQQQQQQHEPWQPQPLPGSHPPLKYAQMGHSRFGRGAPHVCYMHVGSEGLFYVAPDQQDIIPNSMQEALGQLAMRATQAARQLLQRSNSDNNSSSSRVPSSMLHNLQTTMASPAANNSSAAGALDLPQDTSSSTGIREIPMPGTTKEDFLTVAEFLYPMVPLPNVTWDNLQVLLEVGNKWDLKVVLAQSGLFIQAKASELWAQPQDSKLSVLKWLQLADGASRGVPELKEACKACIDRMVEPLSPQTGGLFTAQELEGLSSSTLAYAVDRIASHAADRMTNRMPKRRCQFYRTTS